MLVADKPVQICGKDVGECPDSLVSPAHGLADGGRGGKYFMVMGIDMVVGAYVDHHGWTVEGFREVAGYVKARDSVELKIRSERL